MSFSSRSGSPQTPYQSDSSIILVWISLPAYREIPYRHQPKTITFAEKTKQVIDMRSKWFIMILLSCLAMGTIDAKAQDYRRKHESREQRMLRLSDEKFAILYNKVKSTSFDDRKMDLIEVASLGAFYSCEQCALIMGVFSFGDKQLAALRLMAPRIVDPHRAYLIYEKLTFQSEKDEAARIIGGCGMRKY